MKQMVKLGLVLLVCLSLVACGQEEKKGNDDVEVLKIGILQYAQHPALDQANEGFVQALADQGFVDGDNIQIDFQNAQGNQATTETIADKLVNDGNDLIYAIATPAAQALAQKTQDIPVVISAVTDPKNAGLVESNEAPGGNITGVSDLTPVAEQIALMQELTPEAKTVAIMYTNSEDNSRFQAELAKVAIEAAGLEWIEATVSDISQIQQVTESLVGKADVIYIPTDNLMAEGIATITMVATNQGIPVIVGEPSMVLGGGLATDGIDYYNVGYLAGLQAAKILRGEATPATMPIEYLGKEDREIVINKEVVEALGIIVPEALLDKVVEAK